MILSAKGENLIEGILGGNQIKTSQTVSYRYIFSAPGGGGGGRLSIPLTLAPKAPPGRDTRRGDSRRCCHLARASYRLLNRKSKSQVHQVHFPRSRTVTAFRVYLGQVHFQVHRYIHPQPHRKQCTYVPGDVPALGTPEMPSRSQFQGNVPNVPATGTWMGAAPDSLRGEAILLYNDTVMVRRLG
jgi:hypothetical protein